MPSVYVASAEGYTGKSTVALGVLEQLSRCVERVGVFRPIVRGDLATTGGRDYVLDLLTSHEACLTSYDDAAGVSYDDMHDDPDAALDVIVERYHAVAETCDAVVVVGSDYTDVTSPTEFSANARIAANLAVPVLLVVNGFGRTTEELRTTVELLEHELKAHHATLFAVVANRVTLEELDEAARTVARSDVPGYAIPDEPLLNAPS